MPGSHVGGVRADCSPGGREDSERRRGRGTGEWGGTQLLARLDVWRQPRTKRRCPRAPSWAQLAPRGAGRRRAGAGRGGKLSWRDGLGKAVRASRVLEVRGPQPQWVRGGSLDRGGGRAGSETSRTGGGPGERRGRGEGAPVVLWDKERRRGLEPRATAPHGFLQVSPEGAGDEDSCSSSAPLSPSSSPRSMASGSVCPPGKCVCNSCGLEIVDKYLLKVGWSREAQGERGYLGNSGKREKFPPPFFPFKFSCRL